MKAILSLLIAVLCSCEINQYEARSVAGNSVKETNLQLGGTRSNSRSDGSSYANSYENSLKDAAGAVTSYSLSKFGFKTRASDNALSATKDTNAAGVINTTTSANAAIELGKQKPIITTPPQVVTFPP